MPQGLGARRSRRPATRTPIPDAGEPWQPLKLYYNHTFHRDAHRRRCTRRCCARGLESPYAERLADWKPDPEHERRITTRVPCAEYFATRDQALLAHATQVDPEGGWFTVPLEVHMLAWPTEDYELARSHVESDAARGRPVRRDRARPRWRSPRPIGQTDGSC